MGELRLEAREFTDLTRWRWVLRGAAEVIIAEHAVRLDAAAWQFEAFSDLQRYVWWHAASEDRVADEARIVAEVGAWAGAEVLGPIAPVLAAHGPATVRVVVPEGMEALLSRPLDLAHAGGRPLAAQDITLVMQRARDAGTAAPAGERAPVNGRMRVLGLFSMPAAGQPLSRERDALIGAFTGTDFAGADGTAEVRVLQYGVTRERLRAVLAEGWDIVHVYGHGVPGELLLETASGAPDRMPAAALASLLEAARGRVQLVTLAACEPVAIASAQQRRLLGLPSPDHRAAGHLRGESAATGVLAAALAERLGCAVLATRHPVSGDFAVALTETLYPLLAAGGLTLPRAIGAALARLTGQRGLPPLSLSAPALFGAAAVRLSVAPAATVSPVATGGSQPAQHAAGTDSRPSRPSAMTGFPPRPPRFAGRAGVLVRASAALAPASGVPGLLLHGMPGGGKTACALELAYGHEHAFDRLVWYRAPEVRAPADGTNVAGALTDFALALERGLPRFRMTSALANEARLAGFLPRLTELMTQRRILLVIDAAESLLDGEGRWRDPRWGQVTGALTAHTGLGRLILTSRVPAVLPGPRAEEVKALTPDEALLLARELPRLRALIDEAGGSGRGPGRGYGHEAPRRLARGALDAARGVPLLLELADGQAAWPETLAGLVESGGPAYSGGDWIAAWTRAVTGTLPLGERQLFWLLCCLEEGDRNQYVTDGMCARLWRLLGSGGDPPAMDQALASLSERVLVTVSGDAVSGDAVPGDAVLGDTVGLHPAVAAAGRAEAGADFREAVDLEAAMFWDEEFKRGTSVRELSARELSARAALAAVPYLTRRRQWTMAAGLLEAAFTHDPSRATAAAVLPRVAAIEDHDPWAGHVLTSVLQVMDPAAAERRLRGYLDSAVADGDYQSAAVTAEQLASLCLDGGRTGEALTYAEDFIAYAGQAGLGPWTRLLAEALRLAVRDAQGEHDIALVEAFGLRLTMEGLDPPGEDESVDASHVRELVLGTGRAAAVGASRWEEALDLNATLTQDLRDRGASDAEIARVRFNDYRPLLNLRRKTEAVDLLLDCRDVFTDAGDSEGLGKTAGALASIENESGNRAAAADLQREALRHSYAADDAASVAIGYFNLASYEPHRPSTSLALYLAAALIFALTGAGDADDAVRLAAADLREFGAIPPSDLADLCGLIGDIPGTDLARLIARLAPRDAEQALRTLIARAQEAAQA